MKVLLSTGGTGGHIFPAIAIADELMRRNPATEILFVGALGKMEMKKVPKAGYKIIGLPVRGFVRKINLQNLKVIVLFIRSLFQSFSIIRRFKPNIIMGFGAFASAPVMMASRFTGIPRFIHEQNAYPGVTNKSVAPWMNKIFVAYDGMSTFFPEEKLIRTGNPIRKNQETFDKKTARDHFGLFEDSHVILVTGGSLGARSLNEAILQSLEKIEEREDIHWILQCGSRYFEEIKASDFNIPSNLTIAPFIDKMDWAMKVADIVCARAGALTLSELAFFEKASVLIPSPNVAEDHQTKNAKALYKQDACEIVADQEVRDKLITKVFDLFDDSEKKQRLQDNIGDFKIENSEERIVDELYKTMGL